MRIKIAFIFGGLLVNVLVKSQTYEFFQTNNFHNQLRLNTLTGEVYQIQDNGGAGEMWQFQWSTNSDNGYRWINKIN